MAIPKKLEYTPKHYCSLVSWACAAIIIVSVTLGGKVNVKYHELGILKNTVDNKIDSSKVYKPGYLIKPGFKMITFNNVFTLVEFTGENALSVFNEDGVEFKVGVWIYWKLVPEQLLEMYGKFSNQYEGNIRAEMLTSLKNVANDRGIEVYLENRDEITYMFHDEIQMNVEKLGISTPDGKLHLEEITLTGRIYDEYLKIATTFQDNLEREFEGKYENELRLTSEAVAAIDANRTILTSRYTVDANKIISDAVAMAEQLRGSAEILGQSNMFKDLGLFNVSAGIKTRIIELILQQDGGNNPRYIVAESGVTLIINGP